MEKPAGGGASSAGGLVGSRFWEVDSWRGIAIVAMIVYHLAFDLQAFGGLQIQLHEGFWFSFQRFTAISFIALAGVSSVLSYNRALERRGTAGGLARRFVRRGLQIFGLGMLLSLVTHIAGLPPIDFGVLHLIGASIIFSAPFLRSRRLTLAAAAALYAFSYALKAVGVQAPPGVRWLVPLGIEPPGYHYSDYFPFPHWFAIFLLGIFAATVLYQGGTRKFSLPDYGRSFPFPLLQSLGRHSLIIYLFHQPVLIGLLLLIGTVQFGF